MKSNAIPGLLVVLLVALSAVAGPAEAQVIRKRVAVLPIDASPALTTTTGRTRGGEATRTLSTNLPPPQEFARGLTEMLTTALVQTERFVVVERDLLDEVLKEQERTADSLMAPGRGTRSGAMLGAQVLVRAAVTSYAFDRTESGGAARIIKGIKPLEGLGVARSREKATVIIDVRLIDAESGQVLASESAEGEAVSTETTLESVRDEVDAGVTSAQSTPLGEASRLAVERAVAFVVDRMDEVPWEGRIAAIDERPDGSVDVLYLNAGARIGIESGARFVILRPGATISDPETGAVLGRTRDRAIGRCEVLEVTPTLAVATVLSGSDFQIGDLVRRETASTSH